MNREIEWNLTAWKRNRKGMPILLCGANGVGKTYSILEFGRKQYDNVAYFNFDTMPQVARIFEEDLAPQELISRLEQIGRLAITPEQTLVVLDDIHLCKHAVERLTYFQELLPEHHVIAASNQYSLATPKNAPLLKECCMCLKLYPMDFKEFLLALGEDELLDCIIWSYQRTKPMHKPLHEKALALYKEYLVVGGMPECVGHFADTRDHILVRIIQNKILCQQYNRMEQENTKSEGKKCRLVYDSIPMQIFSGNDKFHYKLLRKDGRGRDFARAIQWLERAGIASCSHRTLNHRTLNRESASIFKIYNSDVGLFCAQAGIRIGDILEMEVNADPRLNGLLNNYVYNQLERRGYTPSWWASSATAQLDFLIRSSEEGFIPIEVKPLWTTRKKSMHVFHKHMRRSLENGISISTRNFEYLTISKAVPLYAVFCI